MDIYDIWSTPIVSVNDKFTQILSLSSLCEAYTYMPAWIYNCGLVCVWAGVRVCVWLEMSQTRTHLHPHPSGHPLTRTIQFLVPNESVQDYKSIFGFSLSLSLLLSQVRVSSNGLIIVGRPAHTHTHRPPTQLY